MKESNQRIGSFDVLRIILSLFVILLHFNNSNGGNALKYTENNVIGHKKVCWGLFFAQYVHFP